MSKESKPKRKNNPGGGRKVGTGNFGEPTSVLRVPESHKGAIADYLENLKVKNRNLSEMLGHTNSLNTADFYISKNKPSRKLLNLYSSKIAAGSPSAVENHTDEQIDINSFLLDQKGDSIVAPVASDSLKDLGIVRGHYVVINRSLQARDGDVVAAMVDNEFTLKIFTLTTEAHPLLKKANSDPQYKDIEIKEGMDFEIRGVVTGTFAKLK